MHPPVTISHWQYIPTVDDGAAVTLAAMRHHGVQQAAVIGHSYGTCIAARLVKQHPEVVHTLALIDPVSSIGLLVVRYA